MSATVTVRMYNQLGLGDCFLLKFSSGAKESFMLIDFGTFTTGNDPREIEIAENIKATVQRKPIIVVLTHQHQDHLSGFITASEIIGKLNIREVWFSYLDDPKGKEAKAMRKVTKEFWNKNTENKKKARVKFNTVPAVKKMLDAKDNIDLFAEKQIGGEAISNLIQWSKGKCEFFIPGKNFDLPGLTKNTVRVYVLGPPTDPDLLRKLNPGKHDAVHSLGSMMQLSNLDMSSKLVSDALDAVAAGTTTSTQQENFPFNKKFTIPSNGSSTVSSTKDSYENPNNEWRRIDHEWLSEMGRMSLHMDRLTNNTSLVLAFELVKSKKVLLFVGDAQIGNWKSWFDITFDDSDADVHDLLSRTVLYKAGHHSSHNATFAEGLDLMDEKELVIMVPVNGVESKKRRFSMLKPGMMAGYNRKSHGRVLRSDTIFHDPGNSNRFKFKFKDKNRDFSPALKQVKDKAKTSHLYIEYTVS